MKKKSRTRLEVFAWCSGIYTVIVLPLVLLSGALFLLPFFIVTALMLPLAYIMARQNVQQKTRRRKRK